VTGRSRGQLALDLPYRPAYGREDFLVAPCNEEAVAWLDTPSRWGAGVALYGPPGCGKSHLLAAFAAAHGGVLAAAPSLTEETVPTLLGDNILVLIDDLDRLASETALFHLFNLARAQGAALVVAASAPPARLPLGLPDLVSRLKTLNAVGIGLPDDTLLAAVLVKQFADRQLTVGDEVVTYLVSRIERSFAAIGAVVAALDRASLAQRRPITVPLARTVLEREV
jgi:DnaA regulatory inactivator Hda